MTARCCTAEASARSTASSSPGRRRGAERGGARGARHGPLEREEFSPPAEVHPLYLRRSDAEIAWDAKGQVMATERDPQPLTVHIVPMRRRHLRSVMDIEKQVYPRPWTMSLFLSELGLRGDARVLRGPASAATSSATPGLMVTRRRGARHHDRGRPAVAAAPDRHALLLAVGARGDRAGGQRADARGARRATRGRRRCTGASASCRSGSARATTRRRTRTRS